MYSQLRSAEEFSYVDPIDGSIAKNQGLIYVFTDNSRIIFRLSGTAGSGATIRMYVEKYEANEELLECNTATALQEIIQIALELSQMVNITGMQSPTVITQIVFTYSWLLCVLFEGVTLHNPNHIYFGCYLNEL